MYFLTGVKNFSSLIIHPKAPELKKERKAETILLH